MQLETPAFLANDPNNDWVMDHFNSTSSVNVVANGNILSGTIGTETIYDTLTDGFADLASEIRADVRRNFAIRRDIIEINSILNSENLIEKFVNAGYQKTELDDGKIQLSKRDNTGNGMTYSLVIDPETQSILSSSFLNGRGTYSESQITRMSDKKFIRSRSVSSPGDHRWKSRVTKKITH